MNRKLHSEFLETSLGISAQFHAAISECGVLPQQRPTDQPLTTMMCRTIAGQQLSVQAARTIWARVLTDSGTKPFAKYLTSASPSQLQTCGLSRSKARAMKEIATAASLGRLEAKELATFTQRLIGYRRKTRIAADRFAPQRSLLARYMWKIADATPSNYQAP